MRRVVPSRSVRSTAAAGLTLLAATGCTAAPPPTAVASPPTVAATAPGAQGVPAPASTSSPSGFDTTRRSVDDPASIWVVVDKLRPLRPVDWTPEDLVRPDVPHTNPPRLRRAAARALERLVASAAADGVRVVSLSAYRSAGAQRTIFRRNLRSLGRTATERLTARPGYSEHQTGLADDLGDGSGRCDLTACFATTPAGEWLADHAWRHGFIERYPRGERARTGIQWEPWHYRYVGPALARHMRRTGLPVLESVLGLPDSPDYG